MSTAAELPRMQELRSAGVLAGHVREELDAAFRSLVTAQQLIKTLNDILLEPLGIDDDRDAEITTALYRMDPLAELDVWKIESASDGAATLADALDLARHKQEGDDA